MVPPQHVPTPVLVLGTDEPDQVIAYFYLFLISSFRNRTDQARGGVPIRVVGLYETIRSSKSRSPPP